MVVLRLGRNGEMDGLGERERERGWMGKMSSLIGEDSFEFWVIGRSSALR